MVNTKGQMKIHQMAFMLLGLVLFFALVALLIFRVKLSGLRESAILAQQENAKLLVSKISNSPEFSCAQDVRGGEIDCIDADKVFVLKSRIDDYYGFWGVSGIEIRKIYPVTDYEECTSSNYPNCNSLKLLESDGGTGVSNFVSLCRKDSSNGNVYDKCEIAKVIITYDENE